MWLLLVEAGIALGLFLFILWWTMGPVHKRETEASARREIEAAQDEAQSPDKS
jgi:hypothetical protein